MTPYIPTAAIPLDAHPPARALISRLRFMPMVTAEATANANPVFVRELAAIYTLTAIKIFLMCSS
ncbi:hypothetical protein D3C81_2248670 [compost metagenome]